MLKVERGEYGRGYQVTVSEPGMGVRAYQVKAESAAEIGVAVLHYYEGHNNQGASVEGCPLCRLTDSPEHKRKLARQLKREQAIEYRGTDMGGGGYLPGVVSGRGGQ